MKYPEFDISNAERWDMLSCTTAETKDTDIIIMADNIEAFAAAYPKMFWDIVLETEATYFVPGVDGGFCVNDDIQNWLYQQSEIWTEKPDMGKLAGEYDAHCKARGGQGYF